MATTRRSVIPREIGTLLLQDGTCLGDLDFDCSAAVLDISAEERQRAFLDVWRERLAMAVELNHSDAIREDAKRRINFVEKYRGDRLELWIWSNPPTAVLRNRDEQAALLVMHGDRIPEDRLQALKESGSETQFLEPDQTDGHNEPLE